MKKRRCMLLAFMLALSLVAGSLTSVMAEGTYAADLYFENGIIYTADDGDTVVEAIAVKDGKIVFVGTAEEGQPYKAAAAEVVDLEGNMLMPGIIDGHLHSMAPYFLDFDLLGITTEAETMQHIRDYIEANPDKETYFAFGYLAPVFEGDEKTIGPRKERLDEICADKPIVIYSFDGHAAWLNTKALEYCGITVDTESTPGGEIVKDENGELWGILRDSAMSFTADFPMDQEKLTSGLKVFVNSLNSLGYTAIMSPPANGFFMIPWAAYQQMENDGELNMRIYGAGIVTSWQAKKDLETLSQLQELYGGGELLNVVGAKIFVDGVTDNKSTYLLEPYTNDPTFYGIAGWTPEALNEAITGINRLGLLAHLHSMGDAATRMGLDAMEYAVEQLGEADYRNAFTHLQVVAPEDFARFATLGAIAVADPYWHNKAPFYWETVEYPALGERAEKEYPMKSFLDAGVVLSFASDYPVTTNPNPFVAIETGITRNLAQDMEYGLGDITDMDDPTYLLWPEERLTVLEMLRGYTIDGAYAVFAEDTIGSLEVGKSADMIIIDKNLLTVNPLDISETQVLRTYFMGKLVYDAAEAE